MPAIRAVETPNTQAKGGVLSHGRPRQKAEVLQDQAGARPRPNERLAGDTDLARLRPAQPGQQVKQRRLAAAGGAEDRPGFTGFDAPIEPVEDRRAVVVAEGDGAKGDHRSGAVVHGSAQGR